MRIFEQTVRQILRDRNNEIQKKERRKKYDHQTKENKKERKYGLIIMNNNNINHTNHVPNNSDSIYNNMNLLYML